MIQSSTVSQPVVRRRIRSVSPAWLVAAVAGWISVVTLGLRLWTAVPRQAGFDLELLLVAGRRVAAGLSPYEPSMLAGNAPAIIDPFYSYPPPVAQYLSMFAAIPSGPVFVVWVVLVIAGLLVIGGLLARPALDADIAPGAMGRDVLLPLAAVAPFVSPFVVAMLFGNLDAAFPLLYGLMLLAVLVGHGTDRRAAAANFAGGASLAIASLAKVHPTPLALWFLVRGLRERRLGVRPAAWFVLAAAIAVGLVIVGLSLIVGGTSPWQDWLTVLRVGSASAIADFRNIGPASQIGLLAGGNEALARVVQLGVSVGALALTIWAAWTRDDPVEGFTYATIASLVILPLTWYHYPVAVLPVAIVAWLRSEPGPARRRVVRLLAAATVISILALIAPVMVWVSVALVVLAVRRSAPIPQRGQSPALASARVRTASS